MDKVYLSDADFLSGVLSNLNEYADDSVKYIRSITTNVFLAVRMRYGSWEITNSGFQAIHRAALCSAN